MTRLLGYLAEGEALIQELSMMNSDADISVRAVFAYLEVNTF